MKEDAGDTSSPDEVTNLPMADPVPGLSTSMARPREAPSPGDAQAKKPRTGLLDHDVFSPLERHLESIGIDSQDPGRRLAHTLASRHGSESIENAQTQVHDHTSLIAFFTAYLHGHSLTSLVNQFEEYQGFFATRFPRTEAKAHVARTSKGKKK